MWKRAVWKENEVEEEGVLPSAWGEGKYIRWPNNVVKALRKKELPTKEWHTFPLIKIKCTSGN
jgi:hypothetical protein